MKIKNKRNYSKENGITLIALVVTIVVLLILAGVSVNALFGNSGIIEKAKEAQNKMDKATENDQKQIGELTNWLDNQVNGTTGSDDNQTKLPKISTLVGTVVDKNTKAEDAYGNKITIPKGFKVVVHGTAAGSATYTYSGDNIPAVQDGIVIENGTDGNQFVWVPVGNIKNKDNTTNMITLGRYEFDKNTGVLKSNTPAQSAKDYAKEIVIDIGDGCKYKELNTFMDGSKSDGSENATSRNLKEFIETTSTNGGYYIARFEGSGTTKIISKYNQVVLTSITQPNAAKLAREMYGDTTDYASDLINSYAWDTTIIFIQTYSTGENASSYSSQNKGPNSGNAKSGLSSDKYCNIWDLSGNYGEWTTESEVSFDPCVKRGGNYSSGGETKNANTSSKSVHATNFLNPDYSLRSIIYVK